MTDGQLRQSQVITTYGPGALVDLPRHSAIMGGLDTWPKDLDEIVEPRLASVLRNLTDAPRLDCTRPRLRPTNPGHRREGSERGGFPNGSSFRRTTTATRNAPGVSCIASP